jgi:hypothetical protein
VPELQRLHPGHAPAVLAFELANRSYFAGFVPAGPADPAHLGGKQGTWYQRDLAAGDTPQQRAAAREQAGT